MKNYIIGYDLMRPGQNYTGLFDAIKAIGNWWHCLDSTWIVQTSKSPMQIHNAIRHHMDGNDKLSICDLGREWVSNGFDKGCTDWLKNTL